VFGGILARMSLGKISDRLVLTDMLYMHISRAEREKVKRKQEDKKREKKEGRDRYAHTQNQNDNKEYVLHTDTHNIIVLHTIESVP